MMQGDLSSNEPVEMTADQYRKAIKSLGLTQVAAAHMLGVDERTSRRYALGETAIPPPVAKLLGLMIGRKTKPDKVA
jgi:hypothetical protein